MEEEITKKLKELKELKQESFNIKMSLEMNKLDENKYSILKEKEKLIRKKIAKLLVEIKDLENKNIERRKK